MLVVTGSLLLAHNLGILHWPHWMRFETLWPLLLIRITSYNVCYTKLLRCFEGYGSSRRALRLPPGA